MSRIWHWAQATDYPHPDDFVRYDTKQQHKPHISNFQEVYYPWHPWYGRSVLIRESVTRRDRVVFRCTIEGDRSQKKLEVPHWMFDQSVCCGMQLVDTPILKVCELLALKTLLGCARHTSRDDLRQDQHGLSPPKGNVDAKPTKASPHPSTGSLSSPSNPPPWSTLPSPIRRRTIQLLAQMLREHQASVLACDAAKEVFDD